MSANSSPESLSSRRRSTRLKTQNGGGIMTSDYEEKIRKFTKEQLKEECKLHQLSSAGNKPDLILRLLEFDQTVLLSKIDSSMTSPEKTNGTSKAMTNKQALREERESILLWTKPWTTINYSTREFIHSVLELVQKLLAQKFLLVLLSVLIGLITVLYNIDGPHIQFISQYEKYFLWCAWWVGLGVLSSVGLGTGLHTFVLYLGPHIASVTMAAYECGTTDFQEPPYPDSILCPSTKEKVATAVTIWQIMAKVRVESICWGAGTALGELPPYFMARAHRLSGYDPDEEDDEFEELEKKRNQNPDDLSYFDRAKLGIEKVVEKVGFFGILACASVPNPLFDLAGITCGHFLVPFWTFFGATLIGKAVIKMHIQKLFIIMAFNETLIAGAITQIHKIPILGPKLEGPFKQFLAQQKEKLHRKAGSTGNAEPSTNLLSFIFEKLVIAMILYFVVSIVNSLAQSYHKRIHKKMKDK